MKNKKIKPYEGNDCFYSDNDEEYEEFLSSVNGKINTSEASEEEKYDDLGETKAINLQGVLEMFKKTATDLKDVSKKITSDAINKIEDIKKNIPKDTVSEEKKDNISDFSSSDSDSECGNDEIVVDLEDIKQQISDAVNKSLSGCGKDDIDEISELIHDNDKKLAGLEAEYAKLNEALAEIGANSRSSVSASEYMRLKLDEVDSKSEEIRQAVLGVSKLSDSIFDLKNAQLNTKNAIENLESGFMGLKKKCVLGITIISILTLISIAMSVIVLLS